MARVYLNALYDRHRYSVDVSEVAALPAVPFAITFAFLEGIAATPDAGYRSLSLYPDNDLLLPGHFLETIAWAEQEIP